MLKKVVVVAAAGLLWSGVALAKAPTNETECKQLMDTTQLAVNGRAIGPKAEAEVQSLMGALAEYCQNGNYEAADQMAALIRGFVASE